MQIMFITYNRFNSLRVLNEFKYIFNYNFYNSKVLAQKPHITRYEMNMRTNYLL